MNKKIFSTLALLFLLPGISVSAETFNSSGTWTAPTDAKTIQIETWGGGGSGGTGYKTNNHHVSGFGGGAGGYASKTVSVTPGESLQVTVGSAGSYGGGSNSEVTRAGTVLVGAGGGGAGMNGVGNYSGSGTSGGSGIGPGAGAGGTNNAYVQRGNQLNEYDNKYPRGKDGNLLLNLAPKGNIFSFIENILSISKVFAQDVPPPEPTFDVTYTGVAGQGGRGYAGDVQLSGASGGGYTKVGDNPYASSGGSSPSGGVGGARGRLGRDGSGNGGIGDSWAMDGNTPGAGGGGSDTGTGGWGAAGRVVITVTEILPPVVTPPVVTPTDVCPNIDGVQTSLPTNKIFSAINECIDPPITTFDGPPVIPIITTPGVLITERFNPKGWLENASCTAISGWAYDGDVPSQPINVHLYDGPAIYGKIITSVPTGQYRGDVNTAESVTGNHGFSYATPSSLKNGADHLIYAYGINNTASAPNTQLLGSPIILNCPGVNPPAVVVPAVTVSANPTALTAPGTVQISWISANINSSTNKCVVLGPGWSSGEKASSGTETSPSISNTTIFTVTCTSTSGGVGSDSVTVPVTTTVTIQDGNGITYNSAPASVTAGQSFNISVTNSGTRTWGSSHQVGILPVGGNSVFFAGLGTTVSSGQKNVTMTAPNTPGGYVIRAVEQGVEWFGESRSLTVVAAPVVVAPPVVNSCDMVSAVPSVSTTPGFPGISGGSGNFQKGSTATIQWVSPSYTGFFADEREPISCSGTNISPDTHVYRNINTTISNVSESSSASGSCSNSKGSSSITVSFRCFTPTVVPVVPVVPPPLVCTAGKVASGASCVCPASTIEVGGVCATPDFSLTASPSDVKVKSIAGYSGSTDLAINLSVNPVPGFNGAITISISSELDSYGPEFSVNGGDYTTSHVLGTLNQNGSLAFLPVKIRFKLKLPQSNLNVNFSGTGTDSRVGVPLTKSVSVNLDSRPLYPGYTEI